MVVEELELRIWLSFNLPCVRLNLLALTFRFFFSFFASSFIHTLIQVCHSVSCLLCDLFWFPYKLEETVDVCVLAFMNFCPRNLFGFKLKLLESIENYQVAL